MNERTNERRDEPTKQQMNARTDDGERERCARHIFPHACALAVYALRHAPVPSRHHSTLNARGAPFVRGIQRPQKGRLSYGVHTRGTHTGKRNPVHRQAYTWTFSPSLLLISLISLREISRIDIVSSLRGRIRGIRIARRAHSFTLLPCKK